MKCHLSGLINLKQCKLSKNNLFLNKDMELGNLFTIKKFELSELLDQ